MSTIAKIIMKYRPKMGISQDKLSKLVRVTFHTIKKIESWSTPDSKIETIKKIVYALAINIDYLI